MTHAQSPIVNVAEYEVNSAKYLRALVDLGSMYAEGTRKSVERLLQQHPTDTSAELKARCVSMLAAAGCYPLLIKNNGKLYGPKSLQAKANSGEYHLDAYGAKCVNLALALERQIERTLAPAKSPKQPEAKLPTGLQVEEKKEVAPVATSTKIVSPKGETVKSQVAALLAKAWEMTAEQPELHGIIKDIMQLVPQI